jgi:hypothetical protein
MRLVVLHCERSEAIGHRECSIMTRMAMALLVQIVVASALSSTLAAQDQNDTSSPSGQRMNIPKLLDQITEPMKHRQVMELERQRIEMQHDLKLLENLNYKASPQWCITAMRVVGYPSIDQYQKVVLLEEIRAHKCISP